MAEKPPTTDQSAPPNEAPNETGADVTPNPASQDEAYKHALRVVFIESKPGSPRHLRKWKKQKRGPRRRS